MGKLDGRVALVTGGQRGLGAASLREMAGEGATCIVNYLGPDEAEPADALVKELKTFNVATQAVAADVTKPDEIAAMLARVVAEHGRLDILVNNAGVNPLKTWEDLDLETWERTIKVNLTGVFNCCRAVLEIMQRQQKGSIVNVASISAFIGRGNADYISSKSALFGLTRSLARQYGKHGIRANCVSPGFHETDMTRRARQGEKETADEFINLVPLGFLAGADSIGKAVLFLASDESYYITGHNLVVDGGLTLR